MAGLGFQDFVRDVFVREAGKARSNGYAFDGNAGYAKRAIEAVTAGCETVDDASDALTRVADEFEREAIGFRGKPEWETAALATGWARTAAAEVWNFPMPSAGRAP